MGGSDQDEQQQTKSRAHERIDIGQLRRDGLLHCGLPSKLNWSCGGKDAGSIGYVAQANGLRLIYSARSSDGSWHNVDETVHYAWTKTSFGGERQWFRCPRCARLCRVLFGGARFRCRRCHGLSYSSQAETRADRATRGMFKIIKRLDPTATVNDLPTKPKGMHWRTYEGLAERYDAYGNQWGIEAMRRFRITLSV